MTKPENTGNPSTGRPPTTPASTANDSNTQSLEVLTDTTKHEVMTDGHDLLAIGSLFDPWKLPDQFDPQMGGVYDYQKDLIKKINQAVKATGYPGGNVVHHGPENQFKKSPGVDYPNTAFEPDGSIVTMEQGPPGKEQMWLKRYFRRKIEQGWHLTPNLRWNWEGKGTSHERKFTVIGGWPDFDAPVYDEEEISTTTTNWRANRPNRSPIVVVIP